VLHQKTAIRTVHVGHLASKEGLSRIFLSNWSSPGRRCWELFPCKYTGRSVFSPRRWERTTSHSQPFLWNYWVTLVFDSVEKKLTICLPSEALWAQEGVVLTRRIKT